MKITVNDIENTISQIEIEAILTGLIPESARIHYRAGNITNGISAELEVWEYVTAQQPRNLNVSFLPVFTYKTTREQQYRELMATLKVLHSLRSLRK